MICPNCGQETDGNFCRICGTPLGGQQPSPTMPISGDPIVVERREIVTCIILCIITLGIYSLYWMYKLNTEVSAVSYEQAPTDSGLVVLLSIVTFGIYMLYWDYKQGERIDRIHNMRGVPTSGSTNVLYLILGLVGVSIVSMALMQNELNTYA